MKNNIKKVKFYLVKRDNCSLPEYRITTKSLKIGRIYTFEDGNRALVLREAHFKYSLDDIQNLIDLLEGGYKGTQQYKTCLKMKSIKRSQIPRVRFSDAEKELIYYIYINNEYNTNEQRETLEKILNIKR